MAIAQVVRRGRNGIVLHGAAGLVDRVHVTIFPVISGRSGAQPIFRDAADFDLELIQHRTLDGNTQELIYRPSLHQRF